MPNRLMNLDGSKPIMENWDDLNVGFANTEAELDAAAAVSEGIQAEVTEHKDSAAAHAAEHITYAGQVTGAADLKTAVDSVKQQLDTAVFNGDSSLAAAQAAIDVEGVEHPSLKARIDSDVVNLSAQLAEKATIEKVDDNANMYWTPPTQPPARTDNPGYFADGFNWEAQQYIDNLFEPLRGANASYITRDNLGKDASGTYDVWRYYLTPKNFTKTIIIGTCIHGGEVTPMLAMYRFLYHMINEWYKYPQLAYIRNNIRIIYIPFQNPWGVSQHPRTRQNSNGVDLNRNFDYRWSEYSGATSPFGHDYKGAAPFSEIEAQYIRNTLKQFSDATVYLDLHNLGTPDADYVVYNSVNAPNQYVYDSLIDYLTKDIASPVVTNEKQNTPSAYNYSFNILKMPSGNPEWADKRFGGSQYNSMEMTKSLEWFSNILLQHSRGDAFKAEDFFIKEFYYARSSTDYNLPVGSSYGDLSLFDFSFPSPGDGLVIVDGFVEIRQTDATAQNFIYPKLGQFGSDFSATDDRSARYQAYSDSSIRSQLKIMGQTRVKRTGGSVGVVSVGLRGRTDKGAATIYFYRMRVMFIPSKNPHSFEIYSASSGSWVQEY